MKEVTVSDIQRYIHHIVLHPFENVNELAKIYFDETAPSFTIKKAAIPELINIPLTKRTIIVNIIREKTNYEISPIREEKMTVIREQGEALQPIFAKEISVVEEVETSDEGDINEEISKEV